MRIRVEDNGWWICLCGNTWAKQGWFPIEERTEDLEPGRQAAGGDPFASPSNLGACNRCGLIVNADSLEFVGVTPDHRLSDYELELVFPRARRDWSRSSG
jgi:hypothetical protein